MSNHIHNTKQLSLETAAEYVIEKKRNALVDSSLVGRWLYLALKKQEDIYVISCRFFKEVNQEEWQFEWFNSETPPLQYTCPEKILKLITSPNPEIEEWMKNCRDNKVKEATSRNENKTKYRLLNRKEAENLELNLATGDVLFKGFYMKSKTEIVVEKKENGSLNRVRLSSIDLYDIEQALNKGKDNSYAS